jgi:hypothetical protein
VYLLDNFQEFFLQVGHETMYADFFTK